MLQSSSTWSTLFFAFLCFQTNALSLFETSSSSLRNPIMNANASSSGVINLRKDDNPIGAFYVEADLSSSSSSSNNSSPAVAITDTVKMMISIANNETLLVSSCESFDEYNCSRYNCSNYGWVAPVDFPTFTAHVTYGKSSIYLDYNYWGLNYSHLFYAQSCETRSLGTGTNRYGVIGLGTGNEARNHFISSPIFSILIDSDQNGGQLLFKKDSNYTQSGPLHTLSANETWQIDVKNGSIETPSAAVAFKGNIMFDINSDVIGLPYGVFKPFFDSFGQTPNVSCSTGIYRPSCTTTLRLEDLPDLILSINGDKIKIPSKIYATLIEDKENNKSFWFNFKQIHESMTAKSYVPRSFQNSVILGANFMSYYYTVFDATNGSNVIEIYSSSVSPSPQPDPSFWWVYVVAVVAIVLIGICLCAYKKKGQAANNNAPFNQAPLVYNQQEINNSADSYDDNYPQVYAAPPPA